jgi:hypothetical protein
MLARVNAERAAAGVAPLQDQPWADAMAREHSQEMAAAQDIWHNMAGYMAQGHGVLGATALAENVSMDRTLDANDELLLSSPEHHQNLVDPRYNFIGIGVALDAKGWVYVTEDFSDIPAGGVKAPQPVPKPAPAVRMAAPESAVTIPAPESARPAPAQPAARLAPVPAPAPPGPIAASPPALTLPGPLPAQGVVVPAPVDAPAAPRVPGAPVTLAAPVPPTSAPLGDAAPLRGAAHGVPHPLANRPSEAPERARRLLPAAGVALFIGALLLSRKAPGPARPPHLHEMALAGSGSSLRGIPSPELWPWISDLARGPPAVPS